MREVKVLFVCMGNICRSPAAEGILKHLVSQDPELNIYVESCGIGSWHVGHEVDWRMKEASAARGVHLTSRAQQFQRHFFDQFDYILVSDHKILHHLYSHASEEEKSKIYLMTNFSKDYKNQEVPDPYYGGAKGFEFVLDMLEESCEGLLKHIRSQHS